MASMMFIMSTNTTLDAMKKNINWNSFLIFCTFLVDQNAEYMADDPNVLSTAPDEEIQCNRKITIKNSNNRNDREFDVSSSNMGAPFSTATNCTVEVISLLKG